MDDREKITNAQQYIQGIRNSRDTLASILLEAGFPVDENDKLQDLIDMFDDLPLNRIGNPDDLTTVHKETLVAAINELDSNIKSLELLDIEVVDQLPTTDISDTTIYLIPKDSSKVRNIYEEWLHVNTKWEKIGDTEVDLSNYATLDNLRDARTALETLINTKASQSDLDITNNNLSNLTNRVSTNETNIAELDERLDNIKGILNATDSNKPVNLNNITETGTYLLVGSYYTPKNTNIIGYVGNTYKPIDGGVLRVFNDTTNNIITQYLETENYSSDLHVKVMYYRKTTNSSWDYEIIPKIDDSVDEVGSDNPDDYRYTTSSNMRLHDKFNLLSNTKQNKLVSGENIKTINGEDILGSGDISTFHVNFIDNAADTVYKLYLDETEPGIYQFNTCSNSYQSIQIYNKRNTSIYRTLMAYDNTLIVYNNFNKANIGDIIYSYVGYSGVITYTVKSGENDSTIHYMDESKSIFRHIAEVVANSGKVTHVVDEFGELPDYYNSRYNNSILHLNVVDTETGEELGQQLYINLGYEGHLMWCRIPKYEELTALLNTKQDTLVSGTNIKTINGESILGSGDLQIEGSPLHIYKVNINPSNPTITNDEKAMFEEIIQFIQSGEKNIILYNTYSNNNTTIAGRNYERIYVYDTVNSNQEYRFTCISVRPERPSNNEIFGYSTFNYKYNYFVFTTSSIQNNRVYYSNGGDLYYFIEANKNYTNAYNPPYPSSPATKKYVDDAISNIDLSSKQDTLVSGTNIKTINGSNILGSGDLQISVEPKYITDEDGNKLYYAKYSTDNTYKENILKPIFQQMIDDYNNGVVSTLLMIDNSDNTYYDNQNMPKEISYNNIYRITSKNNYGNYYSYSFKPSLPFWYTRNDADATVLLNSSRFISVETDTNNIITSIGFTSTTNFQKRFLEAYQHTIYSSPFTPTSPGHPATKKYVDDSISSIEIDSCTDAEIDNLFTEGSDE